MSQHSLIPSVFRIIIKDMIDFFAIAVVSCALTLGIYKLSPGFMHVELSFYFYEQFIELFFINHKLILWLLGLSFGVSIIYFLLCSMRYETTLGGVITRLVIVDKTTKLPLKLYQAVLMAIGAYVGFFFILISPLWAWWLDPEHRGLSEKLARTIVMKKHVNASS